MIKVFYNILKIQHLPRGHCFQGLAFLKLPRFMGMCFKRKSKHLETAENSFWPVCHPTAQSWAFLSFPAILCFWVQNARMPPPCPVVSTDQVVTHTFSDLEGDRGHTTLSILPGSAQIRTTGVNTTSAQQLARDPQTLHRRSLTSGQYHGRSFKMCTYLHFS